MNSTTAYTVTHINYTNNSTMSSTSSALPAASLPTPTTCCCRRTIPSAKHQQQGGVLKHRLLHITHVLLLTTLVLYSGNFIVTAAPSHQSLMPTFPAAESLMLQPELSNSLNTTTATPEFVESNSVNSHNGGGVGHHEHGARALKRALLSNRSIVCNDGSQMSFYLRKNPNSKKWIVFLEGGWHCYDVRTCRARWNRLRHLMTSTDWPETRDGEHNINYINYL